MRWEELFADVAAELDAEAEAERRSEIAERVRVEFGRLRLVDRLQPMLGGDQPIRIGLPGQHIVVGSVLSLGADWVLLVQHAGGPEWLVPLPAVQWIEGLGPSSAEPGWEGKVGSRLGLRTALRRVVRDRSAVAVTLIGGETHHGRLARVGADHVVLDPRGDGRDPAPSQTIPLTAIALLRRA
jgi:hypothetical protein